MSARRGLLAQLAVGALALGAGVGAQPATHSPAAPTPATVSRDQLPSDRRTRRVQQLVTGRRRKRRRSPFMPAARHDGRDSSRVEWAIRKRIRKGAVRLATWTGERAS